MGINFKELRIGNLFQDKYSKTVISVLELLRNGDIVFDFETTEKWQAEPIPFTEAFYLGFELIKKEENRIFFSNFGKDQDGYFLWIYGFKRYIVFVHEFQNIYFDLTKEEIILLTKCLKN